MLALYSAVNVRRFGRSTLGPMAPSSVVASASVIVILVLPISPRAKGRTSTEVSHPSLTHRETEIVKVNETSGY
jgi:hypothetical protein